MQIIEITSVTGTSPYDIIICDITYTYCYTADTGVVSIPPTLYVNLPIELYGSQSVIVKIVDSLGCEEIQFVECPPTPTPTPTLTITPTITPTNANCVCLTFTNPTLSALGFSYTNCDNGVVSFAINPLTIIYACGSNPVYDSGVEVTIGSYCVGNVCPQPTSTPTATQTPTPTIPGMIGSFVSCCDSNIEFKVSNIPYYYYPLSGVYYIVSSGFQGCATYIPTTTSTNIYVCSLIGPQPDCYFCDISHPDVLCPTSTPTPTNTPTVTSTPTPTPTNSVIFVKRVALDCCTMEGKVISVPSYLTSGDIVKATNGNCYTLLVTTPASANIIWDGGTYVDCESCVTCPTPTPTPTVTPTITPTETPTPTPTQTPTPTTPISVLTCSSLNLRNNGDVYSYDVTANTSTLITSQPPVSGAWVDIAHTVNKLWLNKNTGALVREWDITLSPFTITFNRDITFTGDTGAGLCSVDDTTLIVTDSSQGWPFKIMEVDILGVSPVYTYKFDLPLFRIIAGDMLLTTTNKLLVTTSEAPSYTQSYLSQYDYSTGYFELDIPLSIPAPYGLFEDNGVLYITDGSGDVYSASTSSPYTISLIQNTGYSVFGSSQIPSCVLNDFETPIVTPTPSQTPAPLKQFISTWDTSNTSAGSSSSNQVTLPLTQFGTYIGTIDWGDTTTSPLLYSNRTHTYSSPGIYTITISSNLFSGFVFNNTGDRLKLLTITQWGGVFGNFRGCANLTLTTVSDTPDLSNIPNISSAFQGCTSITTINNVNLWNTSNVINMSSLFNGATSFNDNISSWDISNVTSMFGMLLNTSLSTANYDLLLNGWSTQSVQPNVFFFASPTQYTIVTSQAARNILTGPPNNWVIFDGGGV